MRIENFKARIRDLEQQLGAQQIPTTNDSGQRCWLSMGEKELLSVYVDLKDIGAGEVSGQPLQIPDEVRSKLLLWSRVELPGSADPLLIEIRDEARRITSEE